jgi:hypothetical protein
MRLKVCTLFSVLRASRIMFIDKYLENGNIGFDVIIEGITAALGKAYKPFHTSAWTLFSSGPTHSGTKVQSSHTSSHMSWHFGHEAASMGTADSCSAAMMDFLQICLLLTHTSPHVSMCTTRSTAVLEIQFSTSSCTNLALTPTGRS